MSNNDYLEAMRSRILEKAEEEAKRIIDQAKNRANEILEETEQNVRFDKEVDKSQIKENQKINNIDRVSERVFEHSSMLSSYKDEILEKIYQEALRRVKTHVESEEYLSTLSGLIAEAGIALGGGSIVVRLNEEDAKKIEGKLLETAQAKIENATGNETKLVLSLEPLDTIGGVRLVHEESRAIIDNTFEGRLKRLVEQNQSKIESMMFG